MISLDRLLRPKSIAVIGGGAWCENVIRELKKIGFQGAVWPVHPSKVEIGGRAAVPSVHELPVAPDAAFVGVNRSITIDVVRSLAEIGAGGAVCFASGFSEARAELEDANALQDVLLQAAGDMPILGPNCYGFINALDGAALWPDQHGMKRVDRGVAIITQSSNIALNLTMQIRGLPLAYLATVGNQAQVDLADVGCALLKDDRVTALGLHIEGIGDIRKFEALAAEARALGKPIVAIKVGVSEQAQAATVSHTASLAGSDAGARALFARLNIGQVNSLSALLETLKLLHVTGPLSSNRIASMSCSGGEASLVADTAVVSGVAFPPLNDRQITELAEALGPKVALANPLDYHTYIWGDQAALTACFLAMMDPSLALGCVVLDFPRLDRCNATEWDIVIEAVAAAQTAKGVPMAIVASLPETMPETVAERMMARGIVPLSGLPDALTSVAVAAELGSDFVQAEPVLLPGPEGPSRTLSEKDAKSLLASKGVPVPKSQGAANSCEARRVAETMAFPLVLKGEGVAHKTEAGAVVLGLCDAASVQSAAAQMDAERFLIEEMIQDTVAELLLGVVRDPAHGFVLTIGAGGVLTELLSDTASLLVPSSEADVRQAISGLKITRVLQGYRGQRAADLDAVTSAIMALQSFVIAHADMLVEAEINPLICQPNGAVAADALIRIKEST